MFNLHKCYVARLGFEIATPPSEASRTAACAVETGRSVKQFHLSILTCVVHTNFHITPFIIRRSWTQLIWRMDQKSEKTLFIYKGNYK